MPFQYSSSNGCLGVHGDRLPHGRWRWADSRECSSHPGTLRSNQFGGQLTIKQEETGDPSGRFNQNSAAEQGTRYENYHASPSPLYNPATSSLGWSSHNADVNRSAGSHCNTSTEDSNVEAQSRGKEPIETASDGVGSSSWRSDNASFGVLVANLYSNRENKPTPEYPEDETDGVRDIHVAVERLGADATGNEMRRPAHRLQHSWSDTSLVSSVSTDSESISLSREFNNVLAAARTNSSAAGQTNFDSNRPTNILNENSSVRTPATRGSYLPGIGEEEPARSTREQAGRDRNEGDVNYGNGSIGDTMALVPTSTTVAERNRDQITSGRDYLALVPIDGFMENTGSTSDRDAPQSSWDTQHNERGITVESGNRNGENIHRESSSARSNENCLPTPKQLALQKVKRDEIEAKAVAWEDAKLAKVDNRFKREEAITEARENEQKVTANIKMKKAERKMEENRATAFEKMQNEIAKNHRKAENRRAVAEARRGAAKAKISEVSNKIRSLGRLPRKFILF